MFALDSDTASLALSLVVLGAGVLLFGLARPDQAIVRIMAIVIVVVLAWRYMTWRFSDTIPGFDGSPDAIAGWLFAMLEATTLVSSTLALFILSRTRDRKGEADRHETWWQAGGPPQVDLLIATYNEEETILERSIAGALASDHPSVRVWVLDDGRRPWLRALCARLGARYLTREDNAHAKAGNMNAGLAVLRREPIAPDFIGVLDADFVPHTDFVTRALALFYDPKVGLVQTPQHFFNPDPIQHNLGITRGYPDEQRFFFDHIQPARDAWSIAFCCGTSSMMRWRAVEAIGGFPTDSVTEDFLITLRLREAGWSTVYLNEALTEGLAPEGLGEYITQRGRWCLGLMQIVRGPLGPLGRNRLRPIDRLGLIDALLYWASTYPFRLTCLIVPLLYWFFGITVVNAPVADVLYYFLPYYVATLVVLNWISRGMIIPVLNDVSQLIGAAEITKAVVHGLLRPRGHKFKVTAKGGNRSKVVVQWPILRPLLILLGLNVAGLLFSAVTDVVFERDPGDGRSVILFWSFYNILVLAIAMAVCIETPRSRIAAQIFPEIVRLIADGHTMRAWVMRLTAEDAWVRGGPMARPGDEMAVEIDAVGMVVASVTRVEPSGFAVALRPTPGQRAAILRKLHTRVGAAGTQQTRLTSVVTGAFRRVVRR